MYADAVPKRVKDLNHPLTVEKENRWGGKWGRAKIIDTANTFSESGKNWVVDEFAAGTTYSLYNLTDNIAIDITANTTEQITAAAHGLVNDDPYFVGPASVANVSVQATTNYYTNFGKRPKYNRTVEHPIGGNRYAVNEMLTVGGSLEGMFQAENLFKSFMGATCGYVDTVNGNMHWYDEADYDFAASVDIEDWNVGYAVGTTAASQIRAPTPYTPFALLPAGEVQNDGIIVCGYELFDAVYFNIATLGVVGGGDPQFLLQYWNGAWTSLETPVNYVIDDDLGGTHYFDQVNCSLHFQPPWDWIRAYATANAVATQHTAYGYLIRIKLDSSEYATTNPTCNYVAVSYCRPTYTLREYFTRGASPDFTVINGMHPTKFELNISKGQAVTCMFDYIAKGYVPPHNMATCTMPTRAQTFTQPCFYSPGDVTVTWSTPSITNTNIENCRISIDTKGEGVPYVGNDNGISTVDKSTAEIRVECDIPYTNDSLLNQYFADPTTANGQITLTVELHKEQLVETSLSVDPDANSTQITLTTAANAAKLHHGQVIVVKETGITTSYYVVDTANSGTGVVTLNKAMGVNFSTAANVYLCDYVKFIFTNCVILDTDMDDKSTDNPIKRKFVLEPLGNYPTTIPCQISFWP